MFETQVVNVAGVQGAVPAATQPTPAVGRADDADVRRFEERLRAAQPERNPADPGPQDAAADPNAPAAQPTVGDAILDGLMRIKTDYDHRTDRISGQLNAVRNRVMTMSEAMSLQYELIQMNLQQDLTSKLADKTSQGVQTLFRNQG